MILTDTGKHRLVWVDLTDTNQNGMVGLGHIRGDVNHINALTFSEGRVWIGLNNWGIRPSQVLVVRPEILFSRDNGPLENHSRIHGSRNTLFTHDFETFENDYIISSFYRGAISTFKTNELILQTPFSGLRGLACSERAIWFGQSPLASSALWNSSSLSGRIHLYDTEQGMIIQNVEVEGSGQINDLLLF